ncbi:MAG: hypothetical protein EAZ41_02350 [Sphingobacteriia bacterium]|nr:MAG: hypothetical protein EAZ41_02350 [Sphingobacteriia bacterium]
MKILFFSFLFSLSLVGITAHAQRIVYSEPDRDDPSNLNFEIVGKVGGKVLVYKNIRDQYQFSVYDLEMKLQNKVKFDFLPDRSRLLSTDFIAYPDFVYFLYQYQQKNTVYAMAVKFDGNGMRIGDPLQLDTTSNLNYTVNSPIYTFINSEDKQKIAAFKISTKNEKEHIVTSIVFDKSLNILEKVRFPIAMPYRNDYLGEFGLDNEGGLVFLRETATAEQESINKLSLVVKQLGSINPMISDLRINSIYLDDTRLKIDNLNKRILITSFFSKLRRGNIEGLYYSLWDKNQFAELLNTATVFSDEFRSDAHGQGPIKAAFNEFYLKNLILRKDGGFMMIAESAYTSSRGNNLNRWDYMNRSPFFNPGFGNGFGSNFYSFNNPMGVYPWGGMGGFGGGNMMNNSNNVNRYYADNVAIISIDPAGKTEWSNIIRKTQYDDNTDNYIGYGLVNSGGEIRFLFNIQDKRSNILTDQSLNPQGQIDRNPTLKNPERGYDFMPRHAKQVGAKQVVVPCMYRGFTCFAKIDY